MMMMMMIEGDKTSDLLVGHTNIAFSRRETRHYNDYSLNE